MATSYNGWPVIDTADQINTTFAINGVEFPGGILRGDVTTVFRWLGEKLATLEAPNGPATTPPAGECWGWEVRADRNDGTLWSCHASGTAIDWNATRHPNGSSAYYGWSASQVAAIRGWLDTLQVVAWGADFSGTKDPMHFEIEGDALEVAAAAARVSSTIPTTDWDVMATPDQISSIVNQAVAAAFQGPGFAQVVHDQLCNVLRADEFKLDASRRAEDTFRDVTAVLHSPEFAGWQQQDLAADALVAAIAGAVVPKS